MATETLRPGAPAGDECNIDGENGADCPNHYQNVDEAEPDGNTTDVSTFGADYLRDFYNVTDSGVGVGVINSIKVYAYCEHSGETDQVSLKIAINSGTEEGAPDTPTESTEKSVAASWAYLDNTWTTNPATTAAWTWDEIDKLQIGVSIRRASTSDHRTHVTQLYVEVDYTQELEVTSDIDTGVAVTATRKVDYIREAFFER